LRLLFISSFYLFKDTRFGGTKRLYYFAKEWEKKAELSLICMDGCREWQDGTAGQKEFRDFMMVPETAEPGFMERIFRAPSDRRLSLERRREAIRAFLKGRKFDAILLAFPWSLSFLGTILDGTEGPIFFLEDDLVMEQFRMAAETSVNPVRRALKGFRYRQTLAYYRPRMARVKRYIGITRQEVDVMASEFPGLKTGCVSYGIPLEEFPLLPPPAQSHAIGFIGNYGHLPNLDALEWLRDAIIPAVRAKLPEARFLIAGRGMPAAIKADLGREPEVEILENVAGLETFYARITLFLNAVRTGRGLRTKVIEAAAFGRPIVSTSLGVEGLEDLECLIADDAEAMADACARMLGNDGAKAVDLDKSVARNRRTVEERYSLEKVAGDFLAMMAEAESR